ncbi:ADP-ribose pyrophosphatase YjhB (NUDIX family) [Plasticicumulans lactativorans]|uniref:ADP-ribose pyrophosphatase YjhB (NUDIX family) n=1 Tax=Plasticicumulans lactativorans TaxID=1133106 RepID=A0A4R2L8P1_9GAMM|nr:NUDIX hydrolase [Plasticicumulans lactativorans]TCO80466.1 ADP-ribose pyrophosphatase YjhB (NUDIX family) [Plasticicumulans lactativorans]
MNFCSHCAGRVSLRIPPGDRLPRFVCEACGTVHYENPRIVAGCIPEWEGRVLLCRRAIEPRRGLWTLPAGFMEKGESADEAAARETFEEAQARVEVLGLYTLYNLPHISQVYLMYRARLLDGVFAAGEETLEADLFDESMVPWDDIAFPTVRETLMHFFADRRRGRFDVRTGTIGPAPWQRPPAP